jgi:dihydrofolate reductase
MGDVTIGLTMSLDGFIAGANDGPGLPLGEGEDQLFRWYSSGDTEFATPGGNWVFKVAPQSAAMLRESFAAVGACVTGRRTFEIAKGWGGQHPLNVPVFVVTHDATQSWVGDEAPFTFVTDGVESAIARAQAVAGEKNVAVGAASIVQQCLRAGLLDRIHIDLVPVLLGRGVRLFDHLGSEPVPLELTRVIEAPGVTHLDYRVVKS